MSQYSRPLEVFTGSPLTLVGPLVAGFAVWAAISAASASNVMTRMTIFIVPLFWFFPKTSFPEMRERSSHRDHINFNQDVFWKARDFDRGAGWRRLLEIVPVDFVHCGKVSHVLEEDGAAQNFLQSAARGLQNGGKVLEDAVSLRADVACDHLLGGGIDGYLSGYEDQALGPNGLRVGADGLRGLSGGDYVAHDSSSAECVSAVMMKVITKSD